MFDAVRFLREEDTAVEINPFEIAYVIGHTFGAMIRIIILKLAAIFKGRLVGVIISEIARELNGTGAE